MENFDDFDDCFDDKDFMDDDSFEDGFDENLEPENLSNDDSGIEDEHTDDICDDEFTTKEAIIFGTAMNFAYEEGLEEGKRRKLEKKIEDDQDQNNYDS